MLACELGSFTRAASASYISTPAFAQQISLLERNVGFKLFERSSQGVALTKAGRQFEGVARRIVDLYREGVAKGREIAEREAHVLRIGCDPVEVAPFLPAICNMAKGIDPSIEFSFVDAPFSTQIKQLAAGDFDACFFADSAQIEKFGLSFHPLYRDCFCCCMAPTDVLAGRDLVRPQDLAGRHVFIEPVYQDEVQTAYMIDHLRSCGIALNLDETPFDASVPTRVLIEEGLFPVPERYIGDCVPPLVAVPLDLPPSEYGIVCSKKSGSLPAFGVFLQAARKYFA